MATSTVKKEQFGMVELSQSYGDAAHPIDIDNINNGNGYVVRVFNGDGFTGTFPSGLSGNAALIMGMSTNQYGVQLAITFGSQLIAIRYAPFVAGGKTWNAWRYI